MRVHGRFLHFLAAQAKLLSTEAGWTSRGLSTAPVGEATALGTQCKSIYVVNVEGHRHNGSLLIGLMDDFERRLPHVGFFQPIASGPFRKSTTGLSRHVELLSSVFKMPGDPQHMSAITRQQCVEMMARGQADEMMDLIYKSFVAYKREFDIVLVEGTHEDPHAIGVPANRLELNARIAAALSSPTLAVLDVKPESTAESLEHAASIAAANLHACGADLLGVLLNRADDSALPALLGDLRVRLAAAGTWLAGGMPEDRLLQALQLDRAASAVGGTLICGMADLLDASASQVLVASGSLGDTLASLAAAAERPLVITSAERTDILMGLLAAHMSKVGPHAAGIIATNGAKMGKEVMNVFMANASLGEGKTRSQPAVTLPVFVTEADDYTVVSELASLEGGCLLPTSYRKIEHSKAMFAKHIDGDGIADRLRMASVERLTPRTFMHRIQAACAAQPQRIVLPEALDPRILMAASELMRRKLAHVILLGQADAVKAEAEKLGVDISEVEVVDPATSPALAHYVADLVEARMAKGITSDMAADMLADHNYFGTMMVRGGDADGMVSGAVHTTASTIRPALQVLKGKNKSVVSSVFFMLIKDKVMVFGDCAVNVSPSAQDLAAIAASSADTAAAFGINPPLVAMLSYSTGTSGSGPEVDKYSPALQVKEAVRLVRLDRPDLAVEGPIQYDAAVDPAVAAAKIKGESPVAGVANVCIFPDLNTGNNTYKAVQQASGGGAIGPLLQGLQKPINDLSRGCTVADVIDTVLCTSVQALAAKGQAAIGT